MTRAARPAFWAALLAGVLSAGLAGAVVPETEANGRADADTLPPIAVGQEIPAFEVAYPTGVAVVTGTLGSGDTDFFALNLTAGQLLLVALFDEQSGERNDTRIGVFREGVDENDPGVPPVAENDDGGPGFLSRVAVPVTASGTWKVALTGSRDASYLGAHFEGADTPVAYRLVLGVTTASPVLVESDPTGVVPGTNDVAPAVGDALGVGGAVVRGRLERGDRDQFSVPAAAGEGITASLFDLADGTLTPANGELNDTRLSVFPDGATPPNGVQNDDGGPGFLSNVATTVASGAGGSWRVAITGFRDASYEGKHFEGPFDYALVVATTASSAPVPRCDVNGDAFVDRTDVDTIFAARGQPATGPTDPRDADADLAITVLDARSCTLQCGNTNCAPKPAAACGLLGIEALALLVPWAAWRSRRGRRAGGHVDSEGEVQK